MEMEMIEKPHMYSVSVEYTVLAYSEEEAEAMYSEGDANIVDVCDMGEV